MPSMITAAGISPNIGVSFCLMYSEFGHKRLTSILIRYQSWVSFSLYGFHNHAYMYVLRPGISVGAAFVHCMYIVAMTSNMTLPGV